MTEFNSILTIIDPTAEQRPGLDRTIRLATRARARVELFVCEFASHFSTEQAAIDRLIEERRQWLDELARPLRERGIDTVTDVRWDRPLDEVIGRKVIASAPDLVVKDTHYHSVLQRTLFSNTDWRLIRNCPAPLLLAKESLASDSRHVLAAVDPLHEHDKPAALDREILAHAKNMARLSDAQLHVGHVFDSAPIAVAGSAQFPAAAALAVQPATDAIEALMTRHRDALADLLQGHDVPAHLVHLERGSVSSALPELARRIAAGTVVLGAISRSALKRMFLGNTAERVLDQMPCDLLIVKPPAFASDGAS